MKFVPQISFTAATSKSFDQLPLATWRFASAVAWDTIARCSGERLGSLFNSEIRSSLVKSNWPSTALVAVAQNAPEAAEATVALVASAVVVVGELAAVTFVCPSVVLPLVSGLLECLPVQALNATTVATLMSRVAKLFIRAECPVGARNASHLHTDHLTWAHPLPSVGRGQGRGEHCVPRD